MRLDRLLAIVAMLSQRGKVTAPELAEKLEVSRRTISRDIDALCAAGIPVVTEQGAGGGISLSPGYSLDVPLTKGELSAILTGLKGLESVSMGGAELLYKLPEQAIDQTVVINLASYYQSSLPGKIALLKEAIEAGRRVRFRYHSARGESVKEVSPHVVVFQWAAWYLIAWCEEPGEFRLFKLNRAWDFEMLGEGFERREVPAQLLDVRAYFTAGRRVVVLFDPEAAYMLIDAYGPECYEVLTDGRLRFERGFANMEYLRGWLLGFGDRAEVIEPAELRAEFAAIARRSYEKYGGDVKQDT